MPHMNDPAGRPGGDSWEATLTRTRVAVLNVLVVDAALIAVSGWLLRHRAEEAIVRTSRALHDALFFGLMLVVVASYLVRRTAAKRVSSVPPERQETRFFRLHIAGAAIAALGLPLGLAYGWWVDPRLEGVAPFWVLPMALGLLSIPRRGEIADAGVVRPEERARSNGCNIRD